MRNGLSQAELGFYQEIISCVGDILNRMDKEKYIPADVADRVWNICDDRNYGHIAQATQFIENLYYAIINNLERSYGRRGSYSPDELYAVVAQWVESKVGRMIRDHGWQQDRSGEWFQVNNSFIQNRGIESQVTGRRNNMGIGVHRPTGFGGIRQSQLRPVQRVGTDWASEIPVGTLDNEPVPKPQRAPYPNNNDIVTREALTIRPDNRAPMRQEPLQPQPQRSEPVSQYNEIEADLKRSREVTYKYTPESEDRIKEEDVRAAEHVLKVDDIIKAESSDGTEFTVYDLKFTIPSSAKIIASFAQTFLANTESYLARIKFTQVRRFSLNCELYDKALKHIRPAQEDIVKSDKPGAVLDSVIFDNFTRNDGRRVEKFIVDEINRRLAIVFYNRQNVHDLLEIEEVKDIDDVINYQPYLNLLGNDGDRYKTLVRYMVNDVIYNLFTRAKRITRNTAKLDMLIEAEDTNRFVHQGIGMSQALLGNDDVKKNAYLDEYFKRFTVLEMGGVVFYTDIFEEGRDPAELILQSQPRDVYDRVLMAALDARNEEKGNKGFILKDAASYNELTMFIRRPDIVKGYDVTFPIIPTPNKVLKRNPALDVGYVIEEEGDEYQDSGFDFDDAEDLSDVSISMEQNEDESVDIDTDSEITSD